MNKKQLLIAAVAAVLSVTSVNASNISGITNGGSGSFDIKPEHINGDVGYRQYGEFDLSKGDIANLLYSNGIRDIETFINLVDGQVKINGILNTMRDGNFYNGHAVFISPNGMIVGASGVLNVGTLSVATPTLNKYNALKSDYAVRDYTNINQISKLKQDSNANIDVQGKIFARNGVDLRGSNINVAGDIFNGVKATNAITSETQANALFNTLVNTEGLVQANAFESNGSNVIIKSGAKTDGTKLADAGINVSGRVVNYGGGETALTNHGGNGLTVNGKVEANNKLNLYNTYGDLSVDGDISNANASLSLSNKGTNLNIGSNAKLKTDNALEVVNNGSGYLALAGSAVSKGKTDIINEGSGGMNITGQVGGSSTPSVRIVNRGGKMVIANTSDKVSASGTVRLENSGTGMEISGVKSDELVSIENKNGDLSINGKVSVDDGDINILNSGNKLYIASNGNIKGNGNVSVRNQGAGGMTIDGAINNNGISSKETAINNDNGTMLVNGKITTTGNTALKNQGAGMTITKNAVVTNEGNMKIKNYGNDGLTIVGNVDNTGDLTVYNDNGELALKNDSENKVGGTIRNRDGNLAIWSRENSTGISTQTKTNIVNEGAGYNIAIRHDGKTASGNKGMDLQGTIASEGQVAVNNYSGDMYVSGDISSEGNMGIINRSTGGSMMLASDGKITNDTANINIKNYGTGDMTVNSEITHGGRVNVLANSGKLNLGGKVHNNSNGALDDNNGFYAAARENGTGVNVTSGFEADGQGQNLIKNITGDEGLRYEGNMNTSDSQTELYNKKGDMTVGGNINTTNGNAVILNKGDKLTVNGTVSSDKDVKVVNKGSEEADVSEATVKTPNQKWFWEKLKELF